MQLPPLNVSELLNRGTGLGFIFAVILWISWAALKTGEVRRPLLKAVLAASVFMGVYEISYVSAASCYDWRHGWKVLPMGALALCLWAMGAKLRPRERGPLSPYPRRDPRRSRLIRTE